MQMRELAEALGEGNAEHERNFGKTFIPTADYRAVASMSRSLIIGGRGTGKSAIFRSLVDLPDLRETTAQTLKVALAADRTSWPALEQAAKASNNDPLMLSRQWELTLLLLCFNILVENSKDVRRKRLIRELDTEIEKVLERTELKLRSEGMLSEVFDAAATILRKLPFTFKVEAPFVPISVELKDTAGPDRGHGRDHEKLQIILIEGMYGVLDGLIGKGTKVHVLADQLDDHWSGNSQQIASLCALLSAVMRMKGILIQRDLHRSIGFSIFLRSDIYDVLKVNGLDDATKYRRHELHLRWDVPILRRMVDRRIEVAGVRGFKSLDDLLAPERLERRSLLDYFFSRVVPQPRDVIQFLGSCLDQADRRDEARITSRCLQAAEASYSAWRRDVILEEARYGVLKAPEGLLSSLESGPRTYTPKELRRHLDDTKREYGVAESKARLTDALVDWGVLGVQLPRGDGHFVWDVHEGQRPKPVEGDDGEMWIIHPSLWSALDLRPPKRTKSEPPSQSDDAVEPSGSQAASSQRPSGARSGPARSRSRARS